MTIRTYKPMVKAGILLFASVLLFGCNILVSDSREKIAFATLYDINARGGGLETKAFAAALSAKFPPNSSPSELERFVTSVGGECPKRTTEQLGCTIQQTTTICLATYIDIVARINNATISSIQVTPRADGC